MAKATMMLKAGEEEFWANQHPQPYLFPDSPGGTSYERYECYKVMFSRVTCFAFHKHVIEYVAGFVLMFFLLFCFAGP